MKGITSRNSFNIDVPTGLKLVIRGTPKIGRTIAEQTKCLRNSLHSHIIMAMRFQFNKPAQHGFVHTTLIESNAFRIDHNNNFRV